MAFSVCACNFEGETSNGQASLTPPSNSDFWDKKRNYNKAHDEEITKQHPQEDC